MVSPAMTYLFSLVFYCKLPKDDVEQLKERLRTILSAQHMSSICSRNEVCKCPTYPGFVKGNLIILLVLLTFYFCIFSFFLSQSRCAEQIGSRHITELVDKKTEEDINKSRNLSFNFALHLSKMVRKVQFQGFLILT